jgi:prepilin-type N-terminal cleavage/methylation domain-containing protein
MRNNQKGMSLPEVLVAIGIVAVMVFATMTVISTALQSTHNNADKQFATQKAISILEELKALVQTDSGGAVSVLDDFDDGITTKPLLTIQNSMQPPPPATPITLTLPSDPISGNTPISSTEWTYERLITVQLVPGQANDVRLVNVKVYKNTPNGLQLLAEVASVIRTLVTNMPPTQVYDVYCIAVENVPGWWVYMSNVVPFVRNAINDLESRNPGLEFRTHWITTLAYGRDQEYKPYVNNLDNSGNVKDSTQDINSVYFYPGSMPTPAAQVGGLANCCGDDYYYPPFFFKGRVMIDSTETNGYDATKNPAPYALADQYNHAMRYPDEKALYDLRKQVNPSEEMTYRILLEEMSSRPWDYKNALMINLHGELMPFPPARNYSDAAKNPEQTSSPNLTSVRAVTHPEQMRYTNTDPVSLRVYSYLDGASALTISPVPIKITITNLGGKIFNVGEVKIIHGGVDQDGIAGQDPYDLIPASAPKCPVAPATEMCFTSSAIGNTSVLTLYNSPLISPQDGTSRGLPAHQRLYGLEYIPSPVEDLTVGATQFSTDLTTQSDFPKNTARWIITIPDAAMTDNDAITVETRLGDQLTSGVLYPPASRDHPPNLSRTYFWRGDDAYIFGNPATQIAPALPVSERYQFLGDPRHMPYADLKRPHISSPGVFPAVTTTIGVKTYPPGGFESSLGMGYNRYFNDFDDGSSNRAAAEKMFPNPGPFNITGSNNVVALKINGGATFSVTLTTGGARTATQVCANLNGNATFAAAAYCDAVTKLGLSYVRVTSRTAGTSSSVRYVTATGTADVLFNLDDTVYTQPSWPGWQYVVGGWQYGIKIGAGGADDGWDSNAPFWDPSGTVTVPGLLEFDVHRQFQLLRNALVKANAVWTTMTGWSYYYVGIGNEIGYDSANNFPNSIPVSTKPFTGNGSGWQNENTIIGQGTTTPAINYFGRIIRENGGTNWFARSWIGENYPDSAYVSDWMTTGNLPTGVGANKFIRTNRSNMPTFSGTKLTESFRRTAGRGCTTLFWTGTSGSTFHHTGVSASSQIQTAGTDIANNYSFPVPTTIPSDRPFDLNLAYTWDNPENFLEPGAYPGAFNTAILAQYYKYLAGPPYQGAALITLTEPSTWEVSFIAVNGLSPTGTTGTNLIARWSFLSLIQSYLNGGLYTDTSGTPTAHHIRQVPRLTITDPNVNTNLKNPSTVKIDWTKAWLRWDGQPYTSTYPAGYTEAGLTLKYQAMYSPSNGAPDPSSGNLTGWFFVNTTPPVVAYPGVSNPTYQVTAGPVTWNTPAGNFPKGNYLIRVEVYRVGYPLHYAFHQYRAYIQR